MELKGRDGNPIIGLDDKHEITAVTGASCTGKLLPPQLLYTGHTTKCCHPSYDFPLEWDVWHSDIHWANKDTTL